MKLNHLAELPWIPLFSSVGMLMLLPISVYGEVSEESTSIPDATCMECHVDPELEMERDDKTISLFVDPEVIQHSAHDIWGCIDCHEGYDPDSFPHKEGAGRVNCMLCHEDQEELAESHPFHSGFADEEMDLRAPDIQCTQCHGAHDMVEVDSEAFAFHGDGQFKACGQCHEKIQMQYLDSAHHQSAENAPDCLSCHATNVVNLGPTWLELKKAQSKLCIDCHIELPEAKGWTRLAGGSFVSQWIESVHGQELEAGNADSANCVDCHGSHRMKRAMNSDSQVNKFHIVENCQKCHEEEAMHFNQGVHADALNLGVMDAPVCTDCHGEHLILHADDPSSPVAPRNLSQQLCGECHGSVRLSRKYGISSDRFDTFSDSYHGLATRGGSVEVVNCASCHGYHDILPSTNPESPIHKSNLAMTCGECHPKASELYSFGKVHVSIKPGKTGTVNVEDDSILRLIATIYVILIVLVVGGMVVHNLLDFFKKVRRKVKGHRHGVVENYIPHRLYLRMTLLERLQHALLAGSFVILVVTGFMLRYPEAWWVVGLQGISDHLFEWRGWLHRIAGVIMLGAGCWHVLYLAFTVRGRELFLELLPKPRDLTDMFGVLRYNLGLSKRKPAFERFSYIEKTEYWAMIWGTVLMGLTGILMWANELTINYLSKLGFDISRTVHFYEAILATLAIVVWHFYFVIFNPDVYPMNLSWLTGYLSEEEMEDEHPAWLERLKQDPESKEIKLDDSEVETDENPPE